jgi:hypothetical protein
MDFFEVPAKPRVPFEGGDFLRTAMQASWISLPGWGGKKELKHLGSAKEYPPFKNPGRQPSVPCLPARWGGFSRTSLKGSDNSGA